MAETGVPIRSRLRDSALELIRATGGLAVTSRSRWRSRRLLILCYHGFSQSDEHLWDPSVYVTAEHLEARLDFLQAGGYTILPLAEGLTRLAAGTLPPRAVAITVDDGTYDFVSVAYPILKRRGVPVTVFVSTYHVFDQRPVFDVAFAYLLWKASRSGARNGIQVIGDAEAPIRTASERAEAVARVRDMVASHGWSAARKHEWLGQFSLRAGIAWEEFLRRRVLALMRPDEIGALDPGVADIQLHTHRHRVPEQKDLFLREIADNRRALGDCGLDPHRLVHFCYPSGVHRPAFLPWLAEAGIRSGTTCVPGMASRRHHPLLLPRFIDAATTSAVEFESWVSGLRHVLSRPSLELRA